MAFLVFEGINGCGKTSLIKGLSEYLNRVNIPHTVTREPGGTPLADEIRQMLLRVKGGEEIHLSTELLLYAASRAQHVQALIKPTLASSSWVLCDRFTPSTIAFQAAGRGIPRSAIQWLNQFVVGDDVQPDLVCLLDLPHEKAKERMASRPEKAERLELLPDSFHEAVRASYLEQYQGAMKGRNAKSHPRPKGALSSHLGTPWLLLDACLPSDQLLESLIQSLSAMGYLPQKRETLS